ncbi:MAG: glycosyltransferase family 39 protein [Candidatus Dormiibacterota bacterium]
MALYQSGSILAALVQPWNRWDAFWFEHLAAAGYRVTGPEAAFFPAWPAVLATGGRLLGGQYAIAGLALNAVLTVAGLYLLYRLVADDFDRPTAQRTALFTAVAPVAFFFLAPYSEALFLCLTVGAFLGARRQRWAIAAACGLLAALTRPSGVLLFIPLLVEVAIEATHRRRAGQRRFRWGHLAVFAPIIGLAAWDVYVRTALAIPDGVAGAARYWGQRPALPWNSLVDGVGSALSGSTEEWLNLAAVLLVVGAIVLGWRRLPRSYTLYAAAMLVPMTFREATTTPLASDARYALVVFPLFVVIAITAQRRWAQVAVAAVSIPLLLALFVLSAAYDFLG